jgi:predicted metal-binding membrane protein
VSVQAAVVAPRARRFPIVGTSVFCVVAAAAWLVTIAAARDMGVMPAMMLPSVVPLATLYTATMRDHRARRTVLLVAGYLVVWTAAGLVAFAGAAGADRLATHAPEWAHAVAIATCLACGVYQMTPIKDACLKHCRSPLGHLVKFASYRGPLADARVGLTHGGWCLSCCWSLMLLFVTFGVMNVLAMVMLAAIILVEKIVAPGRWFSIAVGIAAGALAVAIWINPTLAPGLHASPPAMNMGS